MLADRFVSSQQIATGARRLADNQTIEGIASPRLGQSGLDDTPKVLIGQLQPHLGVKTLKHLMCPHPKPSDLTKELKLEKHDRRDEDPAFVERVASAIAQQVEAGEVQPDEHVGVEMDQGRHSADQSR